MPRQLKVTREQAIATAMQVFWTKGFDATSIDDLQRAIGIQRGSFYLLFKDKRSLFIEVLDHYKKTVVEERRALVLACPSAKDGIHLYFSLLIDHLLSKKSNSGCLNTNTSTELGLSDEEIAEKMGVSLNEWKNFWIKILKKAKSKKEILPQTDIESTAQLLVALTQGLNVISRVNPDANFLNGIKKSGLSILEKRE
jgi:TetR/AcrR family transcriptional regulator, transcriptional repressor for nem operon